MEGRYAVALTPRAKKHFAASERWWRANRPAASDLFLEELEACGRDLKTSPQRAGLYRITNGREVRRILLPRTRYHVYFQVNESARAVFILAIWHASRGRAPTL
jgi:plasmid stabilization system protein ParE